MPMVINTNNASISTQRSLYYSSTMLELSIQRLSTGKRINSAKDDAAGLAISERMTTQIRGMTQAISNASNAISLAQTAEGALGTITESLQRIRELALQSANDVNSATDRVALNQEATQLLQEIERTATQTTYNGRVLLDGTFTAQQFQIGAEANQTVAVTLGSARLTNIGVNTITTAGTANFMDDAVASTNVLPATNLMTAQNLTIQGSTGSGTAVLNAGMSAQQIAQQVNTVSNVSNVTATARTIATFGGLSANAAAGSVTFDLHGSNVAAVRISAAVTNVGNLQSVADAINLKSSQTGITAASNGSLVVLTSNDGYDIGLANFAGSATGNQTATFQGQAPTVQTLTEGTAAALDSSRVGGRVTFNSSDGFDVTSTITNTFINAAGLSGALSALSTLDISTSATSNNAISVIDGALNQLNSQRAGLGATQKRVTQTISNLQNIHENLSAARSRLVDTDFAFESSALTRAQILQQAGTAMLAQANATPNQVLSLLQQ